MKTKSDYSIPSSTLPVTILLGLISIPAVILASSFRTPTISSAGEYAVEKKSRLINEQSCPTYAKLTLNPPGPEPRHQLSRADRIAYQYSIEEVYWRHRIWPNERLDPKPSLDEVMPWEQIEHKVDDYLRHSQLLADQWQRPITPEQLQAEMERIASHTKQPEILRELFAALGNDPVVIAECLARPILSERSVRWPRESFESWKAGGETATGQVLALNNVATPPVTYALPAILSDDANVCTGNTWTPTSIGANVPSARRIPTAAWTGTEMIVWGGYDGGNPGLNTGGRYNPTTDSWVPTNTTNAPAARRGHTAIWTGTEMIVWGGEDSSSNYLNTGGRYNPNTDSWVATTTTNAPAIRWVHTAVWTGNEMIIWGGIGFNGIYLNTGGRYNPTTNTWVAATTTNAPTARNAHTAVWTGSAMVIWGGYDGSSSLNTGARYNPSTNTWNATSGSTEKFFQLFS